MNPKSSVAKMKFVTDGGLGTKARLGLIVLQTDEKDVFTVARISADSFLNAVPEIGKWDDCDGVFVSCTSLRTMQIIGDAETRLGKPVISSNQALAWHMMRLACISYRPLNAGGLFTANFS